MDKLSKEEVMHVAKLARIELSNADIEKYQIELKALLIEIDKIKDIKNFDENILITPVDYNADVREDTASAMLSSNEIMKNVPKHNGNFVEVPVMIND